MRDALLASSAEVINTVDASFNVCLQAEAAAAVRRQLPQVQQPYTIAALQQACGRQLTVKLQQVLAPTHSVVACCAAVERDACAFYR